MGELTWDYLGHKKDDKSFIEQSDWNVTLLTRINMACNLIYKRTKQSGDYILKLHPFLLPLLESNPYFKRFDDGTIKLSGRYEILLDEALPNDKILLTMDNQFLNKAMDNDCLVVFKEIDNGNENEMFELQLTILKNGSEELTNALNDSEVTVITQDKLIEEIEILNYEQSR